CLGENGEIKNVGVIDSYFYGRADVGGVCGINDGTITGCYNTGKVSGNNSVGGVCGWNDVGTITGCYNTGTVSGNKSVGGVCGFINKGTITSCYNTGAVSGTERVGGVCGYNGSTITNCYFDSDKYSGNAVGANGGTATDVEGKTTAQFASGEVAYLLSQGENGSVWGQEIGIEDYPVLKGKKVLANVDCSAFANDIIVYGQSASLDGTIGFNIYVSADDSYEWDKTVNDVQGVEIENGLYKFTYQVAAKDMDKKINFTVNDKIDVTVSVSDYLAVISETDNAFLKNLADSMSVYGDAAKAYFSGEAVAEQTVTDDLSVYDFTLGTMPEGISYYGSSLILKSETTIRHYFKLAEGKEISEYTFSVDGTTVTPTEKQGYYCIDIKNVRADKLGTSFSVSVNGDEVITNYSALSYVYKVLDSDSTDDNLKNLVKALYLYNLAAVKYNVKTGWVQDGENRYYYDDNGIMQTGWANDIPGFDGARFYFGDDGIMQTGWATGIPGFDGARFYFGDDGIMQTGWATDIPGFEDAWFYFGDDGIMQTGWVTNIPGFDGAWFYFGDDGIMHIGWVQDGENRYYLNDDGIMQTGWVTNIPGFDGARFYFGDDGIMQTGWATDIPGFEDAWFYFGDDGIMQTGWVTNIPGFDGAWFYFGDDGIMHIGWVQDGENRYYLNDDGIMQTGWVTNIPGFDGARFYFGDDGIMQTGWVQDGENRYYYDDGIMQTGWATNIPGFDGAWFYFGDDGIMQIGWATDIPGFDDAWFYFGDDGIMQTGWVTNIPGFEGVRFYFGDDGIMQTSRWVLDGGNLYYLNDDGSMHTGWLQLGENWYYLNDDGSMHTGWLQLGENWYYLNDDGTLLRNGYTPDGYYVDENGMWTGI
ncbi:MAG: GLUG motif-containing protein, partial [Ruminococcus sp.]